MSLYTKADFFEQKAKENFYAAQICIDKDYYNAASTRLYYCLIHLAIRYAIINGTPESLYLHNWDGTLKISKDSICQNAKKFTSNKNQNNWKAILQLAKKLREKADYSEENVPSGEIKVLSPKIENMLISEGVIV
jgi:hypothetical protein